MLKGIFSKPTAPETTGRLKAGQGRGEKGPAVDYRDISVREADFKRVPLVGDLEKNLARFEEITGGSFDINIVRFISGPHSVPGALIYLDGMIEGDAVESLLDVLKVEIYKTNIKGVSKKEIYETVRDKLLTSREVREARDMASLHEGVSMGETAILFDGTVAALLCETKGWETRAIMEPEAETAIRGIREGFVENLRTNTALVRRRIRSPNLWIESLKVGSLSRTEVAFAYIKGLAGEEMLEELRSRLEGIDFDAILESGYIEEFINDNPYSIFPTIFRTERPDRVASSILEGRAAVFVNGSSFALIIPADFNMFMQAPDDYFEIFPLGFFIRMLRYFSFLVSIFLPGIYVAVLNFHPELLPTPLLLRIQATREGVPFPVVGEMIAMEVSFEILREAGIRLPPSIGPAISIVGALILGDAAIRAGIVSPGVVIIVAFTAIASFTNPSWSMAISSRLLRFGVIILGAVLGLLGIQFALLLLIIHLVSLRSFGHPYMAPFGPFIWQDMKDAVMRAYWWQQVERPRLLGYREPLRGRPGQRPRPGRKSPPGHQGQPGHPDPADPAGSPKGRQKK